MLAADEVSCTVILNKDDYIKKVNDVIKDGIKQKKYVENTDYTCNELKHSQDFLYRHFYKRKHYQEMRSRSNQPGQFFATAMTHKSESVSDITLEQLKLRSIIDQTDTNTYKTLEVLAKYIGPLAKNDYTTTNTLSFWGLLKSVSSDDYYEDVS